MSLQGFDIDPCATVSASPPGIGRFEYVPLDSLDPSDIERAVLMPAYNQQAEVPGATWLTLPYIVGTGSWTEEHQDNPQGEYYRVSASAFIAGDTPELRGELNAMRRRRYLCRFVRGNSAFLIGTPEQPVRFESRFDSGQSGGDNRGHRITFTCNALHKSPGYVPVF